MKRLKLIQINTTAYEEEDFYLITDLFDHQIESVIEPIVLAERESDTDSNIEYDNDTLVSALQKAYPKNIIIHYPYGQIEVLSI